MATLYDLSIPCSEVYAVCEDIEEKLLKIAYQYAVLRMRSQSHIGFK